MEYVHRFYILQKIPLRHMCSRIVELVCTQNLFLISRSTLVCHLKYIESYGSNPSILYLTKNTTETHVFPHSRIVCTQNFFLINRSTLMCHLKRIELYGVYPSILYRIQKHMMYYDNRIMY